MRRTNKSFRPRLEALESRWVPATIRVTSGILIVSNQVGPLTVAPQATNGAVKITDNAGSVTVSGVGSLIEILGTNLGDTINFTGNTAGFRGNLIISSGNGSDNVTLKASAAGANVTNGTVTVIQGLGNDSLTLNDNIGGSLTYAEQNGNDTVTVATAAKIGSDASFTGLQNLTLTGALTVGGNLTLTNLSAAFPLKVTGAGNLTVGKSLNVTAGSGNDTFAPTGQFNVAGSASFTFGSGNDTISLTPAAGGTGVGGNLSIQLGSGNDSVAFGANLSVAGNASLTVGDGNDSITTAASAAGAGVAGSMNLNAGSGADSITVDNTVSGNLGVTLGNGDDTVTIGSAPSGMLFWNSGNGNDSVTFGDATQTAGQVWNVFMQFGTGNDTLTLAGNGTPLAPNGLTGFIDMGGPPAGNQFDPTGSLAAGTWVTIPPFTIQNQ
jgi:hypothetical protein